jgi:hypothetical protein
MAGIDSVEIQKDLGPKEVHELWLQCRDHGREIRIIKTISG